MPNSNDFVLLGGMRIWHPPPPPPTPLSNYSFYGIWKCIDLYLRFNILCIDPLAYCHQKIRTMNDQKWSSGPYIWPCPNLVASSSGTLPITGESALSEKSELGNARQWRGVASFINFYLKHVYFADVGVVWCKHGYIHIPSYTRASRICCHSMLLTSGLYTQ